MSDFFGEKIKINIFGESHGPAIGVVIDGLPAGLELDFNVINHDLKRRAPGQSQIATARKESDDFKILSGFFEDKTTGTSLCAIIENTDTRSRDYTGIKEFLRPGHADYTAMIKYGGFQDYRGGGHFSGRLTAPLVLAGAICKQILAKEGVEIFGRVKSISDICDKEISYTDPPKKADYQKAHIRNIATLNEWTSRDMEKAILKAKFDLDSLGGEIDVVATGVKAGFGAPFFGSVESIISHLAFSVPAVKGIEFGAGFDFAKMTGSTANDEFYIEDNIISTRTNNNGGILGGITTGMPLIFTVAIKPTASIAKEQNTVNIINNENEKLIIKGRHDPCIVPRAVVVMEAVCALALVQFL